MPFVHALLENKLEATYTKVFLKLLEAAETLGYTNLPNRVMTDFELGIINAAKAMFGNNAVKCCLFHLCQSVYRHIVNAGLKTQYNSGDGRIKKRNAPALCASFCS